MEARISFGQLLVFDANVAVFEWRKTEHCINCAPLISAHSLRMLRQTISTFFLLNHPYCFVFSVGTLGFTS
jgi:hypothetical protein